MISFLPWKSPPRRRLEPGPEAPAAAVGRGLVLAEDTARALAALRRGERDAVATLYEAEAPRVYRYALALCGNPAWAADATQEAFVALALRPEGFDPARGPLGAWLAGVARHALAAQWRQALGHEPLPEADDEPVAADAATASPEDLLVQAQDTGALWDAMRRLPPVFREAVLLVDLQERPYAEAAAIAGVELNTLRTRVHRGRLRLARLLGGDEGETR
jgi:RNA polymerase sigma-70 factor (ECF subfamily)